MLLLHKGLAVPAAAHGRPAGAPGISGGEDFRRCGLRRGNKSTVGSGSDDARVAIFADVSTRNSGSPILPQGALRGTIVSAGAEGIGDMRKLRSLLRATPSRIGRRIAEIVAIAAASLPTAGA